MWPQPYGGVARDALQFLVNELKAPGNLANQSFIQSFSFNPSRDQNTLLVLLIISYYSITNWLPSSMYIYLYIYIIGFSVRKLLNEENPDLVKGSKKTGR